MLASITSNAPPAPVAAYAGMTVHVTTPSGLSDAPRAVGSVVRAEYPEIICVGESVVLLIRAEHTRCPTPDLLHKYAGPGIATERKLLPYTPLEGLPGVDVLGDMVRNRRTAEWLLQPLRDRGISIPALRDADCNRLAELVVLGDPVLSSCKPELSLSAQQAPVMVMHDPVSASRQRAYVPAITYDSVLRHYGFPVRGRDNSESRSPLEMSDLLRRYKQLSLYDQHDHFVE